MPLVAQFVGTANRVICSLPLLDEEIKKQANGCQSLLKRRIRQASQGSEIRGAVVGCRERTPTQIADIASKIRSCGCHWRNVCSLTKAKKVIEATGIGIKRVGSKS